MTTPPEDPSAALPPELSPRSSGHRAAPAGRRRGHPFLRTLAVVASVAIVLASGTGYAVSQHYLGEVNQISVFNGLTTARPAKADVPAQNILVVGVDDRSTLTAEQKREYHTGHDDYGKRSDTMILFHISDKQKTVTAVSFPRDSLVTIPAYTDSAGNKHPASRNKLNAAYAFGGAKLTIETIETATGIRIDHYVEIDLGGFVRMVDAVGGVDVCTSVPLHDTDSGLNLPAGTTHLNGIQGLAFVRARHIYADQDLGRIKAQQKFVGSMVKRATTSGVLLNPVRLNRFLNAALKSLNTDMSEKQLIAEAKQLRVYKPSKISFLTVPIGNSNDFVPGVGDAAEWDKVAAKSLFTKLRLDQPLTKSSASKITVYPGSITLQVYNAAGVQGLGSKAANDLANVGFGMADVAKNAPGGVTGQSGTVVKYDPTHAAASRTVLASLPGSTGVAVPGLGKTIDVLIGSSYTAAQKVTVSTGGDSTPQARTAASNICS